MSKRKANNGYQKKWVAKRTQKRWPAKELSSGVELKFLDNEFEATLPAVVAGGEMDPPGAGAQTAPGTISAIAQGDGESNRDGRRCILKSVTLRFEFVVSANASSVLSLTSNCFLALVHDTQTNGAQLSAEQVFVQPTDGSLQTLAMRNLQNTGRFRVLAVKRITMSPTAAAGDGTANDTAQMRSGIITIYKQLNIPVVHTLTTAAIAAISDNSLHVIAWTDDTSSTVTIKYISRVRFIG